MSPDNNPPNLFNRTVVICLTVLVGVAFFALVFGLYHCYRKREAARAIEAQDVERATTLQLRKRGGLMTEKHHPVQKIDD